MTDGFGSELPYEGLYYGVFFNSDIGGIFFGFLLLARRRRNLKIRGKQSFELDPGAVDALGEILQILTVLAQTECVRVKIIRTLDAQSVVFHPDE